MTTSLDLVCEFWSMWNRDRLPELVTRYDEFFTEDLEWQTPVAAMSSVRIVGREAFERYMTDLLDAFDQIDSSLSEAIELVPGVVRSRAWIHGRGSQSGVVIDAPFISLARLRDGRIASTWGSFDLEQGERRSAAIARDEGRPSHA